LSKYLTLQAFTVIYFGFYEQQQKQQQQQQLQQPAYIKAIIKKARNNSLER